jgi:hypothetical protein
VKRVPGEYPAHREASQLAVCDIPLFHAEASGRALRTEDDSIAAVGFFRVGGFAAMERRLLEASPKGCRIQEAIITHLFTQ